MMSQLMAVVDLIVSYHTEEQGLATIKQKPLP